MSTFLKPHHLFFTFLLIVAYFGVWPKSAHGLLCWKCSADADYLCDKDHGGAAYNCTDVQHAMCSIRIRKDKSTKTREVFKSCESKNLTSGTCENINSPPTIKHEICFCNDTDLCNQDEIAEKGGKTDKDTGIRFNGPNSAMIMSIFSGLVIYTKYTSKSYD